MSSCTARLGHTPRTYSPPLPLVLDHCYCYCSLQHLPNTEKWMYTDMDSTVVALQHLDHAHEIVLSILVCTLATLMTTMADGTAPMPILEHLELESQTTELILLPSQLLNRCVPPHLWCLLLSSCVLPALVLCPFLLSTTSLMHLALHHIPISVATICYHVPCVSQPLPPVILSPLKHPQ